MHRDNLSVAFAVCSFKRGASSKTDEETRQQSYRIGHDTGPCSMQRAHHTTTCNKSTRQPRHQPRDHLLRPRQGHHTEVLPLATCPGMANTSSIQWSEGPSRSKMTSTQCKENDLIKFTLGDVLRPVTVIRGTQWNRQSWPRGVARFPGISGLTMACLLPATSPANPECSDCDRNNRNNTDGEDNTIFIPVCVHSYQYANL